MKNEDKEKAPNSLMLAVFCCTAYYEEGGEIKNIEIELIDETLQLAWRRGMDYFKADGLHYEAVTTKMIYPLIFERINQL